MINKSVSLRESTIQWLEENIGRGNASAFVDKAIKAAIEAKENDLMKWIWDNRKKLKHKNIEELRGLREEIDNKKELLKNEIEKINYHISELRYLN